MVFGEVLGCGFLNITNMMNNTGTGGRTQKRCATGTWTGLHEYVRQRGSSATKLKALIQKHGVDAADEDGYTPLMIAVRLDELKTAQRLVKCGAKVNACTVKGKTPFMLACWDGHREMARWLKKEGVDCQARDSVSMVFKQTVSIIMIITSCRRLGKQLSTLRKLTSSMHF